MGAVRGQLGDFTASSAGNLCGEWTVMESKRQWVKVSGRRVQVVSAGTSNALRPPYPEESIFSVMERSVSPGPMQFLLFPRIVSSTSVSGGVHHHLRYFVTPV